MRADPLHMSLRADEALRISGNPPTEPYTWTLSWWSMERDMQFHMIMWAPEAFAHVVGSAVRELPRFRQVLEYGTVHARRHRETSWLLRTLKLFDPQRAALAHRGLDEHTFAAFH